VNTLFAGLERAMSENPRIHYLSVGANTYEAPDNVYSHLLGRIEESPYRDRFHMLGWRPWHEIADFYRESDVGLNIDALHYETIYGTRTRLVEMIGAGLPIITTLGSELSYLLQKEEAGLTFDIGNHHLLADHIVALAADAVLRQEISKNAKCYVNNTLSFFATTAPVRQWVSAPQIAPDRQFRKDPAERKQQTMHRLRSAVRQFLWYIAGLDK
jgi:glycosyltransferase involved in cell wall biosynthesis